MMFTYEAILHTPNVMSSHYYKYPSKIRPCISLILKESLFKNNVGAINFFNMVFDIPVCIANIITQKFGHIFREVVKPTPEHITAVIT